MYTVRIMKIQNNIAQINGGILYEDERLRIDIAEKAVYIDGTKIKLTSLEGRLLFYLAENRGRVCRKAELFKNVWQDEYTCDDTLNVHVRRLRMAIEPTPDAPRYIVTVWGEGYIFVGE